MSSVRATLSEVFAGDAYQGDGEVGGRYFFGCHFGDLQFTLCYVTGFGVEVGRKVVYPSQLGTGDRKREVA